VFVEQAAREGMRLSEWLRALAEKRVRELSDAHAFPGMADR